jgi:hypothetical protein
VGRDASWIPAPEGTARLKARVTLGGMGTCTLKFGMLGPDIDLG